jgi:hypothetical protein
MRKCRPRGSTLYPLSRRSLGRVRHIIAGILMKHAMILRLSASHIGTILTGFFSAEDLLSDFQAIITGS